MLDYFKISILSCFCVLSFTACQTRPKSGVAVAAEERVKVPIESNGNGSLMQYVRTPSVIYFDPTSKLVDVTETLEILSYDGAVFGWTIPIHPGHPEFLLTENILQICQDGQKKVITDHKVIGKEQLAAQMYREFDNEDCRGIYVYEILFNKEFIMSFKLSIM